MPKGYKDSSGDLQRDGVMRLATAADEILPLRDSKAIRDASYLPVLIFSRVVIRLGTLPKVTPETIASLCPEDFIFLQRLYHKINEESVSAEHIFTQQNL